MSYQEFKIPGGDQGRYSDSIPDNSENSNQFLENEFVFEETPHNYLKKLEKSIEARDRLIERQKLIQTHRLIEDVRSNAVTEKILQAKGRKIGSFIDRFVYASFNTNKSDIQSTVILNQFLNLESDLGGKILDSREDLVHSFHYHDRNEWFWLCSTKDGSKKQLVRYIIDEIHGIHKSIDNENFQDISEEERNNLINAIEKYKQIILIKIYNRNDLV